MTLNTFEVELETKYSGKGLKKCVVSHYEADNSPALQIRDAKTGEPLLTASVCVDQPAAPMCIIIKGWSENEGIVKALQEAKLIGPTIRYHPTGYAVATEHKMLNQLLNAWLKHKEQVING